MTAATGRAAQATPGASRPEHLTHEKPFVAVAPVAMDTTGLSANLVVTTKKSVLTADAAVHESLIY